MKDFKIILIKKLACHFIYNLFKKLVTTISFSGITFPKVDPQPNLLTCQKSPM